MKTLRIALITLTVLTAPACWSQTTAAEKSNAASADEKKLAQGLSEGGQLARVGKFKEALVYFDQVAFAYEEKYKGSKDTILCARSSIESLAYLADAASKNKKSTIVLNATWSDAYYLKAYTLVSLGQIGEAKKALDKAIVLSPGNSQYRAELGNIYQNARNWPLALETFQRAETNAQNYSMPEAKNADLSRAWRGQAYVLVELGRLDEAEKLYRQCLKLDSNDQKAQAELLYIQEQRAKKVPG